MERLYTDIMELKKLIASLGSEHRVHDQSYKIYDACLKLEMKYYKRAAMAQSLSGSDEENDEVSPVEVLVRRIQKAAWEIYSLTEDFTSHREYEKVKDEKMKIMEDSIIEIGRILKLEFKEFES